MKKITLRVSDTMHEALREIAFKERISINTIIVVAISQSLIKS